jgi:hypothetical protein
MTDQPTPAASPQRLHFLASFDLSQIPDEYRDRSAGSITGLTQNGLNYFAQYPIGTLEIRNAVAMTDDEYAATEVDRIATAAEAAPEQDGE